MKILVADYEGGHGAALSAQLQAVDGAFSISQVGRGEPLLEAVRRFAPDVVIVDMARPDRDGLDSVRLLSRDQMVPVLMFIDEDDPAFMEEAIAAGVSSYHVHGIEPLAIKPVLRAALGVFQRMRVLAARLQAAEEQIAARQVIEQAKRLLMTRERMTEPAAHRYLQRRAMDQQKKVVEVAQALLRTAEGKAAP